jgi:hypothetical protein
MTSPARSSRPELTEIRVPGEPWPWIAAGFTLLGDEIDLGGVALRFGADHLAIAVDPPAGDVDGLPIASAAPRAPWPYNRHENRATGVDHVVAFTPAFERTRDALAAAGFDHRRDRDAGGGRSQAFFVLGPCLLELVGPVDDDPRFWGLTVTVEDIDATSALLGDRLGAVKDAVQPGRRIATVRREAGLGVPLAFITPRD